MSDGAQDKPQRSQSDKERSRQQSRAISGKEAARTVGAKGGRTQPQKGPKGPAGSGSRPTGRQGSQGGRTPSGRRPQASGPGSRPPGRPSRGRPGPRPSGGGRPRSTLITWGIIGLVIVVILVFVIVKVTSGPATGKDNTASKVPAAVLRDVTQVSTSVYNTVGTGGSTVAITPPAAHTSNTPLTFGGKPGLFYMGGEFCPYCAAERWAIISSLSRFGTFTGLQTMASSSVDTFPSTPTFTFTFSTYKSTYLTAKLVEYYGQEVTAGTRPIIGKLTKAEQALVKKYDVTKSNATNSGGIPFVDIGNKYVIEGASYSPTLLASLTRTQIASGLSDPANPVTKSIIGTSNYISAAICAVDGAQPASVCTSKGVAAATKALQSQSSS